MSAEGLLPRHLDSPDALPHPSEVPTRFPVTEGEREGLFGDVLENLPPLEENVVLHLKKMVAGDPEGLDQFLLLRHIAGLSYIFSLAQRYGGLPDLCTLLFKTKEYEYARTKLTAEQRDELYAT